MFGSLCVVCFSLCVSRCVWKNWRLDCCVAKKSVDRRTRFYYNNAMLACAGRKDTKYFPKQCINRHEIRGNGEEMGKGRGKEKRQIPCFLNHFIVHGGLPLRYF